MTKTSKDKITNWDKLVRSISSAGKRIHKKRRLKEYKTGKIYQTEEKTKKRK